MAEVLADTVKRGRLTVDDGRLVLDEVGVGVADDKGVRLRINMSVLDTDTVMHGVPEGVGPDTPVHRWCTVGTVLAVFGSLFV